MDCVAEVLVILGSHDPHDGTDRGHMVPVPAPAFTKHRHRRQVSGQCCSKFSGSWMQNQVRHSLIDLGMCHVCIPQESVWSSVFQFLLKLVTACKLTGNAFKTVLCDFLGQTCFPAFLSRG
jgi:hypothetical protein